MAIQKVHWTLQAYDSRDSEVAEGLHVNSEEDTSRQETRTHYNVMSVLVRSERLWDSRFASEWEKHHLSLL